MFRLLSMTRHRKAFSRAANTTYLHSQNSLFQLRYMSSETPPRNHEVDMNYVHNTMNKWIQSYVIDHDLCPFAKKSDYRIAIWPHDCVDDMNEVETFIQNEIEKLLKVSDSQKRPNTFIIFPLVQEFRNNFAKFEAFDRKLYLYFDDTYSGLVQFFPFHMVGTNLSFKTPWPTIHILRKDNLDKVRQGGTKVSKAVAAKNASTLACEHTRRKLLKIVIESAQFPDPITVTKPMCPKQKEELHEKGIHVIEALAANSENNGINKKKTQIIITKKKRLRKSKGRKS